MLPQPKSPTGDCSRSRQVRLVIVGAGLLGLLAPFVALHAQALRVTARDSVTGNRLAYVLLDVLGESGDVALSTMTSGDGSRFIKLPGAGTYRILLRRVGFRAQTLGPVKVGLTDTLSLDARVPKVPVTLPTMRVDEGARCDLSTARTADASRTIALWEQLRTALRLNELAQLEARRSTSRSSVRQYVTRVDGRNFTVLRHTVLPERSNEALTFGTFSSGDISASGYVRHEEGSALYVAPNEKVLLSNAFVTEHCFRLVTGAGAQAGLIGLAFTPVPSRRVPEIAGTLWADSATGTPSFIDFWFIDEKIPGAARGTGKTGGEVYFAMLADETWATTGWRLRMPQLPRTRSNSGSSEVKYVEVGALASEPIDSANGPTREPSTSALKRFMVRFAPGSVNGVVTDALTGQPLKQARVTLRQSVDSAGRFFEEPGNDNTRKNGTVAHKDTTVETDDSGRIRVDGLPSGNYELQFTHAAAVSSGFEPATIEIAVQPGAATNARMSTVSLRDAHSRCAANRPGVGIYGVVREGEGDAPPFALPAEATITARWQSVDGIQQERRTSSDGLGRYALCELPAGISIKLQTALKSPANANLRRIGTQVAPLEQTLKLDAWRLAYVPITVPVLFSK